MRRHLDISEDVPTGLRTNSIRYPVSFKFFNKIISCGRRGQDQGLGPPPLWSVAGEGGLRSGLEGSVGYGERGVVPRPEPKLGDRGASSFGLRLRTGERCSRRGRSKKDTERRTVWLSPTFSIFSARKNMHLLLP